MHKSPSLSTAPLLQLKEVHKRFALDKKLLGKPTQFIYAVNGVSLSLYPGKTTGLVGESGCGKSTVGRIACGLESPDRGEVRLQDQSPGNLRGEALQEYHRSVQMIFQNPYTSLNPRQRIGSMLREIYRVHHLCRPEEIEASIGQTLQAVGLDANSLRRFPFEFSGGQRQRLCIARALSVQPRVVVCDEPVSALDVSVQAQILRLLQELQRRLSLAYLFISHDLSVVYHICDEVIIMYLGKVMERGAVEEIFRQPAHPYTQALLSAVPSVDAGSRRRRIVLQGELPSGRSLPAGCPFYSRCPQRMDICRETPPPVHELSLTHHSACWLHGEPLRDESHG